MSARSSPARGLHEPAVAVAGEPADRRVAHDARAAASAAWAIAFVTPDGSTCPSVGRCAPASTPSIVHQREQLERPLRSDDLERHPDLLGHAAHVEELVHAVLRLGQAHRAAAVEADRLAGLLLERVVQVEAALQQPHDVRVADELGAEAGRVPGGAGRELIRLQQGHVAPAQAGEVVDQADAGDTAADHRHAGAWRQVTGRSAHVVAAFSLSSSRRLRVASASTVIVSASITTP